MSKAELRQPLAALTTLVFRTISIDSRNGTVSTSNVTANAVSTNIVSTGIDYDNAGADADAEGIATVVFSSQERMETREGRGKKRLYNHVR